jgi:hypothetical protein
MPFKRTDRQMLFRKRANAVRYIAVRKRSIAELEARIADLDAAIAASGDEPPARTPPLPFRAKGEVQLVPFDVRR